MTTKQYIVQTPNPEYGGTVFGVRFYGGRALIAEHTISPYLDRTVEEIVDLMRKDFGDYEITEVEPEKPNEVTNAKRIRKNNKVKQPVRHRPDKNQAG